MIIVLLLSLLAAAIVDVNGKVEATQNLAAIKNVKPQLKQAAAKFPVP